MKMYFTAGNDEFSFELKELGEHKKEKNMKTVYKN